MVQRPLWGSTSTKNPEYRDVLYVEQLIGPNTVDTMPPATIDAFRDHGVVDLTLERDLGQAQETLARLEASGIDLKAVTHQLQVDGVRQFSQSFIQLIDAIDKKRKAILEERVGSAATR